MEPDESAQWLPIPEAATRLGITVDALRSRIRRGQLEQRRNNDGRLAALVVASSVARHVEAMTRQGLVDGSSPTRATSESLVGDESVTRQELADARAETERWRQTAEERGMALAKAEAALGELRGVLEREQARGDRLEAELRRPWWRRLIG